MARGRAVAKVLIIARGPVGAFAHALAAMRRIRSAHPSTHISLLTTPPFEALARACPYLDAVDVDGEPEEFGEWAELVLRIRRARFDRVYDLECSPWTNRLLQFLRPLPPKWSGTAFGCALPHRDPSRQAMHPLERQAGQLHAAGVWPNAPTRPGAAPPPDASWIARRIRDPRATPRPHVLLAPGAPGDLAGWPAPSYGELAMALRSQGYDIVIVGGPEDSPNAQAIQRRAQVRDLTGRTDYAQVAALAARAALAIGADGGMMSLIAAAGAPALILCARECDPDRIAARGHVAALWAEGLAALTVDEVLRAADHLTPPLQKTM
jgi:ADP-heptose:LPS heptosyltransferase